MVNWIEVAGKIGLLLWMCSMVAAWCGAWGGCLDGRYVLGGSCIAYLIINVVMLIIGSSIQ